MIVENEEENEDHGTPPMVKRILRDNPQREIGRTLVLSGEGPEKGGVRPFLRLVRCSRRLLDPTNLVGSGKAIEDRIVKAGLVKGDSSQDIALEVSQIQVATEGEEGFSVTITYEEEE